MIRLGVSPLLWANDDLPELVQDTPFETCLAEASRAGFSGTELGHRFPKKAEVLEHCLQQHDLVLVSGWYGSRLGERSVDDEFLAMQPHLRLLQACGVQVMVFAEVSKTVHSDRHRPLDARPKPSQKERTALHGAINKLARRMCAEGMQLAYHHHLGTVIETEVEIDQLMHETDDAVGLLLDTGHLAAAGGDAVRLAKRWGPRLVHVHLKDIHTSVHQRLDRAQHSFLDAVLQGIFCIPSHGSLAFEPLFATLKDLGYAGWLVVEADQDPRQKDPLIHARASYAYVRTLANRAQLTLLE